MRAPELRLAVSELSGLISRWQMWLKRHEQVPPFKVFLLHIRGDERQNYTGNNEKSPFQKKRGNLQGII